MSKGRYFNNELDLGKDFPNFKKFDSPTTVESVKVKGKFMYWTFSTENDQKYYMFSTFGMTGQWGPNEGKHPCFKFEFSDGSKIFFNDPRHFGTIKFTSNYQTLLNKLNDLGWDPFTGFGDQNKNFILHSLKNCYKPIAQTLMDQSIFCGVGNYIRAECLYLSKISPWKKCNMLSEQEVVNLCESIIQVMTESYQHQGATIATYKTPYGEEGKYSTLFKVYSKDKDPLGNPIVKDKTADGRTIHWCPAVQQ